MRDPFLIRPLASHDDFAQAEEVQRAAWGMSTDSAMVPFHLLITIAHNGGLVLGAFAPDGAMVGFLFGFLGRTVDERAAMMGTPYYHCSHMMGVRPEYQGRSVGYRLKCAQRDYVLGQGLPLVVWTYDPLMSANAWLNVGRLGVICRHYIPNLYGEIREELNAGLPTDRFEVEWWIASDRVTTYLDPAHPRPLPALAERQMAGAEIVNRTIARHDGLRAPAGWEPSRSDEIVVEIPTEFQAVRRADMACALDWRLHTREIFQWAFAEGYAVGWFARERDGEEQRSYYVLRRDLKVRALAGGDDDAD
jgi:predicted GNAT superfamily acetyltransferase